MESLQIPIQGLDKKMQSDKIGSLFLVVFTSVVAILAAIFCMDPSSFAADAQMLRYIIPVVTLVGPVFSLKLFIDIKTEQNLLLKTGQLALVLGPQGLEAPIAVLEGPTKDNLRKQARPRFSIRWDIIEQFIVEPIRGRRKSAHSPPYFKITIKGKKSDYDDAFFIRRQFFRGQEEKIVEFAKQKLGADRIILNDKLR